MAYRGEGVRLTGIGLVCFCGAFCAFQIQAFAQANVLCQSDIPPPGDFEIAYEPFDYPMQNLQGSHGGHGFGGPWTSNNPLLWQYYQVATDSLSYGLLQTSGSSMRGFEVFGGVGEMTRSLSSPLGAPGTTRYFSFLLRREATAQFNSFFGLCLGNAGGCSLFVGTASSPDRFVLAGTGQQVDSGVTVGLNQVFLLVVRAEFHQGNDVFTLFVNPPQGTAEPSVGVVKNDSDIGTVDTLMIQSTGAFSLDEIRIGNTYEEVFPAVIISDPLNAQDKMAYGPVSATLWGANGGCGFSTEWFTFGAPNHVIGAGSLAFLGLLAEGNRVTAAARTDAISETGRLLIEHLGTSGTTRYLSFVLRPEGVLHEGLFSGFFGIVLRSTAGGGLFVGKPGGGALDQYVLEEAGGVAQFSSGASAVVGQSALLVVRADFAIGNDTFTLYVDPLPGEPEPLAGTIKNDADLGAIDFLAIYSTGAFSLDEIRLGKTFAQVVPPLSFVRPDLDLDEDVDHDDFWLFHPCLAGPGSGPPSPPCLTADFGFDSDVDLADFAALQRCFSDADNPPDPNCAG